MSNNDDWDDDEYDSEADDDSSETITCPSCKADVYEDAVQCPICGEYITSSTSPWVGKPQWWKLIGVLGIVSVIAGLAGLVGR